MSEVPVEEQRHAGPPWLRVLLLVVAYIVFSALLINFNKFLMAKDRFPFALALTAMHMGMSSFLSGLLYLVKPSMFPSMTALAGRRLELAKWFLPIGVLFAISLAGSNQAYMYCGVAFLQFMKEGNLIIVFMLSCCVGLQKMTRPRLAVILWVLAGAAMSVAGEVRFVWIGFVFQAISQLSECTRAIIGEWVLTGGSLRLDPLTYTMHTAPVCFVVLLLANAAQWDPQAVPKVVEWWRCLIPNACLAFVLNITIASLVKEVSAVGFVIAGLVKDVCIVVAGCLYFGEQITHIQGAAFCVMLTGVFFWSHMKMNPTSAPVRFLERMLCVASTSPKGVDDLTAPIGEKQVSGEKQV